MTSEPQHLCLYLFGPFRFECNERSITLPTRQAKSLLAYLTLDPKAHSRDALATLLWGDSTTDDKARHLLRTTLTALREHVGDGIVIADRNTVQLNPATPLWVDAREFDRALQPQTADIDDWQHAISLYRDDLLTDLYSNWIEEVRERYHRRYVDALLHLAQEMRSRSEYERAIEYSHKVLACEPSNERAHQHIMFGYVMTGNRPAALRQYKLCMSALRTELDLEPSAETQALHDWIKHASAQRKAREAQITNLPIPLTSFIGRKRETAEVKRLLTSVSPPPKGEGLGVGSSPRLVTLTGAGGSGKTRLAIQAATDLIDHFKDGVWWVELAPLVSETLVPQAIAKALGVQEASDQALTETIADHLHDKHALLVLDNCEHVLAVCARSVQSLLETCPDVRVLVTSREPLGMLGEAVRLVPVLSLPDSNKLSLAKALLEYESFRLFAERAQAANAAFVLTDDQALTVAQICQRLDGIPLAIELAAARVRSMTVGQIAANLDDRFNLLTSGNHSALPRHQTLRAAIDWSYALLSEPERLLFRRLSVFVGGWTLEAAGAVTSESRMKNDELRKGSAPSSFLNSSRDPGSLKASPEAGSGQLSIFNLLSRLVDKSLVLAEQYDGDMRYRMLETIHEYAAEKLVESGEQTSLRDRHLDFFTWFAEHRWHELTSSGQQFWWERFDAEQDNFLMALDWAMLHQDERGLKLTGALGLFWFGASRLAGQRALLNVKSLLNDTIDARPSFARAQSLQMAALLAANQDDISAALPLADESLTIARALGEEGKPLLGLSLVMRCWGLLMHDFPAAFDAIRESLTVSCEVGEEWTFGLALVLLGILQRDLGDYTAAREAFENSLAAFRKLGDEWMAATPQTFLGEWFCIHGDVRRARDYLESALKSHQAMKNSRMIGETLNILGDVAELEGDLDLATQHYEEGLTVWRELGSQQRIAAALSNLGRITWRNGNIEQAKAIYRESLSLFIGQPDKTMIAYAIGRFACFLASVGEFKNSACLFGAAHARFETLGARIRPLVQSEFDRYLEVARTTLSDEAFTVAYAQGRSMTLDQVIIHGLEKM